MEINNYRFEIIKDLDGLRSFCNKNSWAFFEQFDEIFRLYGFPINSITMVIDEYYIDAAYRDLYYHYWSSFHFDWKRYCKRIFLFSSIHKEEEFLYDDSEDNILNNDFLGIITIRPSYSGEPDHTFGRTLLNPYKMIKYDGDGNSYCPYRYIITTEYEVNLFCNTFKFSAFAFSSQDGVAMKCAETAIYVLCEQFATSSPLYARKLPSDIQEKLYSRLSERVLPSHGMIGDDISYLLREFGFSTIMNGTSEETDKTYFIAGESIKDECMIDHETNLENWLYYYVESGFPVLMVVSPNQEVNKHAILGIGHSIDTLQLNECRIYHIGKLPFIDTSELYKRYIVQDDNQIPYREELMNQFTQKKNCKLDAIIVPLDRHIYLDAPSAVTIFDTWLNSQDIAISSSIVIIKQKAIEALKQINEYDEELRTDFENELSQLINGMEVSEDNPIVIRYCLANSSSYKKHRISNTYSEQEKVFYAGILMPKYVWLCQLSTYHCYEQGILFAEVVLDATASSMAKMNSIIISRISNKATYRMPNEEYEMFEKRLNDVDSNNNLPHVFYSYSNFV